MTDRSGCIFGNRIAPKDVRKAAKSKAKYAKKYGDDSAAEYSLAFEPIDALSFLGANNIVF